MTKAACRKGMTMKMLVQIGLVAAGLAAPAHALTTRNLTCEMPGVGQAALITGFEERFQLFEWWDKTGDTLGMKVIVLADCADQRMLRASTLQQSDALMAAWDVLWTAGRAGQAGDFAVLSMALEADGFTVETLALAPDHCTCTDEMIGQSGH